MQRERYRVKGGKRDIYTVRGEKREIHSKKRKDRERYFFCLNYGILLGI